ncbi:threonine dehydrogenase-like Zn-dependent dehydrogenase [Asanoa ferruginea]|uniref:Threonine dehydrogenase-like Zn-dependent dehydrogenase n=1 Tax=Asanoa ferruginea TaxID=53367 RepID=A0A3D9ZLR1_9ACTN|nr:zinc-binding dehydrogenase [Asanoa ferruginea]REF98326.1 threonine dehydrogenase-like Zn-dependent dehydrogenase [Asanoa ferruginea]GIF52765.1 alcohol dehydrogenase [Asanoa ferruginea]
MWAQTILGPFTCARIEVETPGDADVADGQVLLRVLAAGICGSDLPMFRSGSDTPIAGYPLHEVAGEVVISRDPTLPVGAKVVGWATAHNAAAEYAVVDGSGLLAYDETLKPVEAIVLQPLACVIAAVREQLSAVAGATVAVLGLGPIGMLFAHVLKNSGARSVTGVDRVDRSDLAAAFGLDEVVTMSGARWVAGLGETRPEIVVEAVGHQVGTFDDAIRAVADRGRVLYYGIPDDAVYPLPMEVFLRKNATLSAGYTRDKRTALAAAAAYLDAHPDLAGRYVTHVRPMDDLQGAFELANRPAKSQLKIVLVTE